MNDTPLAERLQALALCNSSEPAEAVAALVGAGCAILLAKFSPLDATAIMIHAMESAFESVTPPPRPN